MNSANHDGLRFVIDASCSFRPRDPFFCASCLGGWAGVHSISHRKMQQILYIRNIVFYIIHVYILYIMHTKYAYTKWVIVHNLIVRLFAFVFTIVCYVQYFLAEQSELTNIFVSRGGSARWSRCDMASTFWHRYPSICSDCGPKGPLQQTDTQWLCAYHYIYIYIYLFQKNRTSNRSMTHISMTHIYIYIYIRLCVVNPYIHPILMPLAR